MLVGSIHKLLIASLLILLTQSSVHAEPLRYSWKNEATHVYAVEIATEISGETNQSQGEITVTTQPYEPSKLRSYAVSGSSVVISADGYALTCAHVVKGVKDIKVMVADREYSAERVYIDLGSDLALLKINDAVFQPAELAELQSVNLGQAITSIGFPLVETLGATLKVNRGIVSGITFRDGAPTIQIDATVNPGNSGGPVFNDRGQVAAIVDTKLAGAGVQDVGFAVPIKTIREFLDIVRKEKQLEIKVPATQQREPVNSEALAKQGAQCVGLVTGTANAVGPGAVKLSYAGNFGEAIRVYGGGGSSRSRSGSRSGTYFLRTAPNPISGEAVVDQLGEIYESKHGRQLPYLLGPLLDLAIVQFPENETKSWTNNHRVQLNQNATTLLSTLSMSGWGFVIRGDDSRAKQGTFDATETIAHREVQRDEHRVVLNRDYSLRTNDKTERPTFSLTGKGQIEFDLALGVVRRHEMRFTLIQESENVTVRLPVSLKFTMVDPEVIEQRKREVAAQMARVEAEKQAVEDAEAAMAPAARVEYYLTQIKNSTRGSSGSVWVLKLRDMEPTAEQRELVTGSMLAIGLDTDSWIRREAMQVLERWATKEDVPKLLKLAAASDNYGYYVHGPAFKMLANFKVESAVDLMVPKLKETWSRKDAAEALKLIGFVAEEKVLASFPEEDTWARSLKFEVLTAIGTEKSIAALKEQKANSTSSSDSRAIDKAIGAIEARLTAEAIAKQNPAAAPENAAPATAAPTAPSRDTTRPESPTSLTALRSVIQELRAAKTVVAKITAIKRLESLSVNPEYQVAVEKELHKYIQPGETALWPIIASALAKWGTPASLDKLQEMLQADGDNETLTILIIANLQRMDSREAALLLLPMTGSEIPVIRAQAISALSSVGNHVEPELIELLKSPDEQLQYEVVAILRSVGTAASRTPLLQLRVDTTSARVREAAQRAHTEILKRGRNTSG